MSMHMVLGLLGMGASGKTANEIWTSLYIECVDEENIAEKYAHLLNFIHRSPLINIANQLFVQENWQLDVNFNKLAASSFGAGAQTINYADSRKASSIINKWVSSATKKHIQDLIAAETLTADTKMVIVNAPYFKGEWETPFDPSENKWIPFHLANGKIQKDVEIMRMDDFVWYIEVPELDAKVMELPYQDSNMKMVFLLPNTVDGIVNLGSQFYNPEFLVMLKARNEKIGRRPKVLVSLPKFKVEFSMDLENALIEVNAFHISIYLNDTI